MVDSMPKIARELQPGAQDEPRLFRLTYNGNTRDVKLKLVGKDGYQFDVRGGLHAGWHREVDCWPIMGGLDQTLHAPARLLCNPRFTLLVHRMQQAVACSVEALTVALLACSRTALCQCCKALAATRRAPSLCWSWTSRVLQGAPCGHHLLCGRVSRVLL